MAFVFDCLAIVLISGSNSAIFLIPVQALTLDSNCWLQLTFTSSIFNNFVPQSGPDCSLGSGSTPVSDFSCVFCVHFQ